MTSRRYQQGLTLLEIMVALAIGVFMLAGILSMVVSVSTTRVDLDKTSEQIENGRYALHLFSENISLAGYYGESLIGSRVFTKPDPCSTTTSGDFKFFWDATGSTSFAQQPLPVFGFQSPADMPTDCLNNAVSGSEVLVLNMVDTQSITTAELTTLGTTNVPYVQYSACLSDTQPMKFGTTVGDFNLLQRDCATSAVLWRYKTLIFHLSNCSNCANADGIPTLRLEELQGPTTSSTPLVEGVEDVHFQYGLDFDDDGAPDCYADNPEAASAPAGAGCPDWDASVIDSWSNVVAIRVNLLVRSIETVPHSTDTQTYDLGREAGVEPAFNDGYKRQVYSSVITIPNVSGIRE